MELYKTHSKQLIKKPIDRDGVTLGEVPGRFIYTIGLGGGKASSIEFLISGFQDALLNTLVHILEENYSSICTSIKKADKISELIHVNGFLKYKSPTGEVAFGPMSFRLLSKKEKKTCCLQLFDYYDHSDFLIFQVFICDEYGRDVSQPDYDAGLLLCQLI
jgi:hypothetical protein